MKSVILDGTSRREHFSPLQPIRPEPNLGLMRFMLFNPGVSKFR